MTDEHPHTKLYVISVLAMLLLSSLVIMPSNASATDTSLNANNSSRSYQVEGYGFEGARGAINADSILDLSYNVVNVNAGTPDWLIQRTILHFSFPSGSYTTSAMSLTIRVTEFSGSNHLAVYAPTDASHFAPPPATDDFYRYYFGACLGTAVATANGDLTISFNEDANSYFDSRHGADAPLIIAFAEEVGYPYDDDTESYVKFDADSTGFAPHLHYTTTDTLPPGSTRHWDGGGVDNLASNRFNWDNDASLAPGDVVHFETGKNCTWDVSTTVYSITVNGYAGVITQSDSYDIRIGLGGFTLTTGQLNPSQTKLIYCAGNWTQNGGTLTAFWANIVMSGSGVFLDTDGVNLRSLKISGDVSLSSSAMIYNTAYSSLVIDAGAVLRIPSTKSLVMCYYYVGSVFTNNGQILGDGLLDIRLRDTDKTITVGTLDTGLTFSLSASASATRTLGLNTHTYAGDITLTSLHASNRLVLDVNGFDIHAEDIVLGARTEIMDIGAIYADSWNSANGVVSDLACNFIMSAGGSFSYTTGQDFSGYIYITTTLDDWTFTTSGPGHMHMTATVGPSSTDTWWGYVDGVNTTTYMSEGTAGQFSVTMTGSHVYRFIEDTRWYGTVIETPWNVDASPILLPQGYSLLTAYQDDAENWNCWGERIQVNSSATLTITGKPAWLTLEVVTAGLVWHLHGSAPYTPATYDIHLSFYWTLGHTTTVMERTLYVAGGDAGWAPIVHTPLSDTVAVYDIMFNAYLFVQNGPDYRDASNLTQLTITKPSWMAVSTEISNGKLCYYFSGESTVSAGGSFTMSFSWRSQDGGGYLAYSVVLTLRAGWAPTVTDLPLEESSRSNNTAWSYQIQANESATYHLLSGPAGLAIDTEGLITWVPSSLGTFTIRFTALSDAGHMASTITWSVTVTEIGFIDYGDVWGSLFGLVIWMVIFLLPAFLMGLMFGRPGMLAGMVAMPAIMMIVGTLNVGIFLFIVALVAVSALYYERADDGGGDA